MSWRPLGRPSLRWLIAVSFTHSCAIFGVSYENRIASSWSKSFIGWMLCPSHTHVIIVLVAVLYVPQQDHGSLQPTHVNCAVSDSLVSWTFQDCQRFAGSNRPPHPPDISNTVQTLAKVSLSTAVAIDITIASTLTYYLHTSRTGIRQCVSQHFLRLYVVTNRCST